jgi:hypothetical protein
LDPESGKNSSRIRIPDPGGKKAPDPGSATLVDGIVQGLKLVTRQFNLRHFKTYSEQKFFK